MTPYDTTDTNRRPSAERNSALLERILEKVESIDENVDAILDRLDDCVDRVHYGATWPDTELDDRDYA